MMSLSFKSKNVFLAILTVFLVLSLVIPGPFYLTGCAKKEKLLENKSLRTESRGEIKFHSETLQQDITVKAQDNEGNPLQGMNVQYSVTERYVVIMVRDPKGNHLPDIFVGTPDDFKEKRASMSLVRSAYANPAIITTTAIGATVAFTLVAVAAIQITAGYIAPIVSPAIVGGLEAISSVITTAIKPTSVQIKGPPQKIFSQLESKNLSSGVLKVDLPDMEDPIWLKFAIPEFYGEVKQEFTKELLEEIAEKGLSLYTGEEYEIEIQLVPVFNFPIVVKCEPIKGAEYSAKIRLVKLVNITNTPGPYEEVHPSWSPDGSKIVFAKGCDYTSGGPGTSIWVMSPDGNNQFKLNQTVGEANLNFPDWSPDGTKIAYVYDYVGGGDIWVMNADGSNQRKITFDVLMESWPDWNPSGNKIIYLKGGYNRPPPCQIWIMDSDGSNKRQLTFGRISIGWPQWSPDGTRILFTDRETQGGYQQIYIMNSDGSNIQQLTVDDMHHVEPCWSPDGAYIAYGAYEQGSSSVDLWIVKADGSGQKRLTYSKNLRLPKWSPNRNIIACWHGTGGRCDTEIYLAYISVEN